MGRNTVISGKRSDLACRSHLTKLLMEQNCMEHHCLQLVTLKYIFAACLKTKMSEKLNEL